MLGNQKKVAPPCIKESTVSNRHAAAKTTAVGIATENFGSGTASTMPTGWTTGAIAGPYHWRWTNTASPSTYSGAMGTMNSTTKANVG